MSWFQYANRNALSHNPLMKLLFLASYPIAILFRSVKWTPNSVSALSFLFAVASFVFLLFGNALAFAVCWYVSLSLDFADGTLARMTGIFEKFRIDHLSDLVKIGLLFFSIGLWKMETSVWIFASLSLLTLYLYTIFNHELGSLRARTQSPAIDELGKSTSTRITALVTTIRMTVFSVNAHQFLVPLLLLASPSLALPVLIYYSALFSLNFFSVVRYLWDFK